MKYFKFVGSKKQVAEYTKPNPEVGVVYPMSYYGMNVRTHIWASEWQEVFVYDKPEAIPTQKSFLPDAVTLDTYESGKWYNVKEVLPDESVEGRILVAMWDESLRQAVWDDKDERFIGIIGDTLDDVACWLI